MSLAGPKLHADGALRQALARRARTWPLSFNHRGASQARVRREAVGEAALDGAGMEPPEGQSEPRPPTRSSRILGLLAAVGFSILMWAFIAVAVLGLILKIMGPR